MLGLPSRRPDPYWERFLHTPVADEANLPSAVIRGAPDGPVNPTRAELHAPAVTTAHLRQFAKLIGALELGVVATPGELPFSVVLVVPAPHDPTTARGFGGQLPVRDGAAMAFMVASYLRELGWRATCRTGEGDPALAVAAGLGRLDPGRRFVSARHGRQVHVAEAVRTDLPLAPDGVAP